MAHVSRLSRGMRQRSAAVVIARKHQSAPGEHFADRAIKDAAEEISQGRYVPDPLEYGEKVLDNMGIALGLGTSGVGKGEKPSLEDFRATRDLNEIARHPRVLDAMERMKLETESTNSAQAIEASWAMHEMQVEQKKRFRWEGQERWQGKENEEMRIGRVMSPGDFHARLCKIIGEDRVLLSRHAVKTHPEAKSARCGLYVANPESKGPAPDQGFKHAEAAKLKAEGLKALTQAKRLRLAKMNAAADKKFDLAGQMAQEATKLLMEASSEVQLWPPEFLRVGVLQWPMGTEWMIMHFDEFCVPVSPKYLGWRTALLTMVRTRAITEREANKAFPVGSGPAADWYRQQMQLMRNGGKA